MSHLLEIDVETFARSMGADGLRQFEQELRWGVHAREVMAAQNQQRHQEEVTDVCAIDSMGMVPTMAVDGAVFHYWGQRLGYECWDDPQFIREFQRDNPEVRAKYKARRTTLFMPGMPTPNPEARIILDA